MNYTKILKRAWTILWHYPALWVFGFFLAFLGGSSGRSGTPGGGFNYSFNNNDSPGWNGFPQNQDGNWSQWLEKINRYMDMHFGAINERTILTWAIIAVAVIFFLVVVATILRYVALTAHIRMVNHLEESGEKVSWRKGFKWGWSTSAFRLWLMDLLVTLPTVLVFMILFGCAAIPVLLGLAAGETTTAAGVIATIGMGLVVLFLAFVVGLAISLWLKIAQRVCVIDGLGVIDSLKTGWKTGRKSLKDILIMWLILIGVQIAFGLVMIPIFIILIGLSVAVLGGIGLLVYSLAAVEPVGLIIAGIVFLIFILGLPITLIQGLGESYYESVWTLVYRETKTPVSMIVEAPAEP